MFLLQRLFPKLFHERILTQLHMEKGLRLKMMSRETGNQFNFYAIHDRNERQYGDLTVYGARDEQMDIPCVGCENINIKDVFVLEITPLSKLNTAKVSQRDIVRAMINRLRMELMYDERRCIYIASDGVTRIYLNRECNINESGFSASMDWPREDVEFAYCSVFISWGLVDHYVGNFVFDVPNEPVPGFTYYSWMGGNVSSKEKRKELADNNMEVLKEHLTKYRERRDKLDKELDKIVRMLEHSTDVYG